jgi:hypothetical protein
VVSGRDAFVRNLERPLALAWAQFVDSLRALAAELDVQIETVPGACVADELALDFAHWYEVARYTVAFPFTNEELNVLNGLDHTLDQMSGTQPADLWSNEALRSSSEWASVRTAAKAALHKLGYG